MKTILFRSLFFGITLTLIFSCGSDGGDEGGGVLSSQNLITNFTISGVNGTIDNADNTVAATVSEDVLTSLTPTITVSNGATISPASGIPQDFTTPVIYTVTAEDGSAVNYTVTVTSTIFSFTFNGTSYELIRERMTWENAAAFAVERGGFLAEINSSEENAGVVFELVNNAGIDNSIGGSSVWLGGNDLAEAGTWIFDGDNDGNGFQFWSGGLDGMAPDGVYTNWSSIAPQSSALTGEDTEGFMSMQLVEDPFVSVGEWVNSPDATVSIFFLIEFN